MVALGLKMYTTDSAQDYVSWLKEVKTFIDA